MKILAVDDEADTRRLLKDLLEQAGHRVTVAADAIEAMLHLKLQNYDLILLDLMMPGIEGPKLAQIVGSHWNTFDIPILVISCRKDEEAKTWARLIGCVRYIEKPFSPPELLDAVLAVRRRVMRRISH